jgi:hypothetical protein
MSGKREGKKPVEFGEAFRQAADDALAVLIDMARTGSTAATKALRDRGLVSAPETQEKGVDGRNGGWPVPG